jgi:hypothetical protein
MKTLVSAALSDMALSLTCLGGVVAQGPYVHTGLCPAKFEDTRTTPQIINTRTNMSGSDDASYHDDDDEATPPGGGSSKIINTKKMKRSGKRRTTADDDDDDEDTNDHEEEEDANDDEEDEAQAGAEEEDVVIKDNTTNAEDDDDDDDHAEEVTASLSKITKIVNNLIARADSIPFREPGKTITFFDIHYIIV